MSACHAKVARPCYRNLNELSETVPELATEIHARLRDRSLSTNDAISYKLPIISGTCLPRFAFSSVVRWSSPSRNLTNSTHQKTTLPLTLISCVGSDSAVYRYHGSPVFEIPNGEQVGGEKNQYRTGDRWLLDGRGKIE